MKQKQKNTIEKLEKVVDILEKGFLALCAIAFPIALIIGGVITFNITPNPPNFPWYSLWIMGLLLIGMGLFSILQAMKYILSNFKTKDEEE